MRLFASHVGPCLLLAMLASHAVVGRDVHAQAGSPAVQQLPAAEATSADELAGEPRTFRDWDGFDVGAWKQVRVIQQTLRADGSVEATTITETRMSLQEAEAEGFTLHIESAVEVATKRFQSQPQEIWYGYHGQSKEASTKIEKLGSEMLLVDGREVSVDIHRIRLETGSLQREVTVYVNGRFPFVYRKRTRVLDMSADKPVEVETVAADVIALGMPYAVQGEIRSSCHVKTVLKRSDSQVHTIEVQCEEVPGRVIAHWSKQLDAAGRVRQRSTLQLIDYGLTTESPVRTGRR